MSDGDEADKKSCCASCGIAEIDDIKLVPCDDCDLVKYCSDECQKNHWSQHETACKKRAAELRDELLFKQPESTHHGDCPICCLPLPIDPQKSTMMMCCSKVICGGCNFADQKREKEMRKIQSTCPFCRETMPETDEKIDKLRMKRVEMNDPVAMSQEGIDQRKKGEYQRAFEYFSKSAELGNTEAHYKLSLMYYHGQGVEKDEGKEIHHTEEAAIGGHPLARYNLGCEEMDNGNIERAVKHWIIAATQGEVHSMKTLMDAFKMGLVSKGDLATALRAHHTAVEATKSLQRLEAEEYHRIRKEARGLR